MARDWLDLPTGTYARHRADCPSPVPFCACPVPLPLPAHMPTALKTACRDRGADLPLLPSIAVEATVSSSVGSKCEDTDTGSGSGMGSGNASGSGSNGGSGKSSSGLQQKQSSGPQPSTFTQAANQAGNAGATHGRPGLREKEDGSGTPGETTLSGDGARLSEAGSAQAPARALEAHRWHTAGPGSDQGGAGEGEDEGEEEEEGAGGVPVFVFDELDSGIGGSIGGRFGQSLLRFARSGHQVCHRSAQLVLERLSVQYLYRSIVPVPCTGTVLAKVHPVTKYSTCTERTMPWPLRSSSALPC